MGNPENKHLKDLLAKKNSAADDDFEKEAMEGFDLLNSDEEVLELKSKLDSRVRNELFREKKSASPLYWVAAAAMLLITGISMWYILNDSIIKENKDLAITTQKEHTTNEGAVEQSFEAKAAELKPAQTEEKQVVNTRAKKTNPLAEPELKLEAESQGAPPAQEPEMTKNVALENLDMKKPDNDEAAEHSNTKSLGLSKKDNEAPDLEEKSIADIAEDARGEKIAAKKESRKAKAAAPAPGVSIMASTPAIVSDSAKNGCYYVGGDMALKKELEAELKEKGLNKPFEAMLILDMKQKVSKVTFLKATRFTNQELKIVETILLSLDKFEGDSSKSGFPCQYRLFYKPTS